MENEYNARSLATLYMWMPRNLRDKSQDFLPLTKFTIQVWDQFHRSQTASNKFLKWAPIGALHSISPWLSFAKWSEKGITHIDTLCSQGEVIPFPELQVAHDLPPSFIFPYMQLKSIIKERVLLAPQLADHSSKERLALYDRCRKAPVKARSLSLSYAALRHNSMMPEFSFIAQWNREQTTRFTKDQWLRSILALKGITSCYSHVLRGKITPEIGLFLLLPTITPFQDKQLIILVIMAARNLLAYYWKRKDSPSSQTLHSKIRQYLRHEQLSTTTTKHGKATQNNWQKWIAYDPMLVP
ncbi:Hypothetical predicted protein [Pelobates cultripes]|uniref:Uncharacterized protein n=1 Tax=Pelobates cultripes TaxID=61616 RepID=A0AAD1R9T2_PELCU|nr:Hypothetical predicted protein [Pelobates cultripes]